MINGGFCQIIFTPPNEINVQDKPDEFWENYKMKNEANFAVFENLAAFVLNIVALPHSYASCERVFSKVNNTITKSRNRLINWRHCTRVRHCGTFIKDCNGLLTF
jgi:hypothetical protein